MAFIPFIILIILITCCIAVFGNATLDGASQVSLLIASAVSVLIGYSTKRLRWEILEQEMANKISSCTPAIIILLLIGAIGGTWMVSGIVPTMIYYGIRRYVPVALAGQEGTHPPHRLLHRQAQRGRAVDWPVQNTTYG